MRRACVVAQAKVNLFLRILAREASGYHQIETLFQRVAIGDEVGVRVTDGARSLDCRGADVGPVERNLAWRAARDYAARADWPRGFAIEIDKRIPVGGGLGGGSADAGAVLRCLDALAPTPLGPDALLEIAAPLGADVPFLTSGHPLALAWGRGERMLALPPLPDRDLLLAVFDDGVVTADAYGWLAAARDGAAPRPRMIASGALAAWRDVAPLATNDFEPVVLPRRPVVARAHAAMAADGASDIVLLAGSGASVFAVRAPGSPVPPPSAQVGVRYVVTRTASRVAAVEIAD